MKCPMCETENPEGSKFCGALRSPAPHAWWRCEKILAVNSELMFKANMPRLAKNSYIQGEGWTEKIEITLMSLL